MFVVSVIVSAFLNCVFTPFVFAEERTYEGVGEYVMSDFETPDIAKQRAKSRAEQNAVEQAGVYVDSYTKSVNAVIVRDEITVITNGILRVIDTKYSFQPLAEQGGSFLVQARIKAVIDTKLVDDWLKQSAEQKQQLVIQIEELTNNTKELEKEIASLKQQLATAKTEQDTATIKKEMETNDKKFQANEKRKEGLRLLYDTKDYNSGLACFNEAIKLDPDNALSYCNRAEAYILIRQYLQAIADCNKAIALNPEEPKSYRVRAHAYMCTSDPQGLGITNNASLAIADINKFLSMKPLTTNNNVLWHVYFVRRLCFFKSACQGCS